MIVGFTGLKESGKNAAALALTDLGWVHAAYADELRAMLYTLDPIVLVEGDRQYRWQELYDTWGYDRMKKLTEARRLMKYFGEEVMRQRFGQDVWVNLLWEKRGHQLEIEGKDIVVTDVRYDNEAEAICRREGMVIEVVRPGLERDDHASEQGIDPKNITTSLVNNSTIEVLHEQVKAAVLSRV